MKMVLGFFIGMTVCLLLVFIIMRNTTTVSADSSTPTVSTNGSATTSPAGTDINGLMPDVVKIFNNALGEPYRQVESEITDPGIAKYFHALMDSTGLDKIGATSTALTLSSIAVTPASPANLAIASTQQFTATGTYADGSTKNITSQVTWVSSDPTIAAIFPTGLAIGVKAGNTYVTATMSGLTGSPVTLPVVSP